MTMPGGDELEMPSDIPAEQSVLGAMLIDNTALNLIADWLKPEDFYRLDHQMIFRGMNEMAAAGEDFDAVLISDWFAKNGISDMVGGLEYMAELYRTTPSSANVVAYAGVVREKSQKRALADIGKRLIAAALRPTSRAVDVCGQALLHLSAMDIGPQSGGLVSPRAAIKRLMADFQERYGCDPKALRGIPTPWHDINMLTKGLRPGVFYVVGARPSMGKSVFGGQLAGFAALREIRTALFSVEMTADEVIGRLIASVGEVPHAWLDVPIDDSDADTNCARVTNACAVLVQAALVIDETPALRVEQLMSRARREHQKKPLQLIVIDHMHDMGVDPKAEARHEYGRIAQGAKTLAKELKIPVVMLAQLNRANTSRADKRPTLSDLRESGEIEQKADVVLFLHREDYYDAESYMKGAVEVIVAKGRNLPRGNSILLANRFDQMRMDDWEGERPRQPQETSTRGPRRQAPGGGLSYQHRRGQ